MKNVILDTGPLISLLSSRDRDHAWAVARLATIQPPLLTCEAVLSEAHFLLRRNGISSQPLNDLVLDGKIQIAFQLKDEMATVAGLMIRYANVPMSLADACLVRMSELYPNSTVLTADSDFNIYRRHTRQIIPVMMPAAK